MNDYDDGEGWHAHELMLERYRLACEALNRCAAAGAKSSDVCWLARELGINLNDISRSQTRT
ncbi:MAG TPA: hypothetical protein VFA81_11895 [Burkholderiales bacterium]|nr:hypothetical protein [Burkholderiales bacterium]